MKRDKNYRMNKQIKRMLISMVDKSDYKAIKNIMINGEIDSFHKRPRKHVVAEDKSTSSDS